MSSLPLLRPTEVVRAFERLGWREAMTAKQRADMTLDLLSLWQPDLPGDDAEALIRVQRAFALWPKKHA